MALRVFFGAIGASLLVGLAACSGGSSSPIGPQTQSGNVPLLISDASSEDWATIGVKVLSITLTPQGGGTAVPVYTAPSPAPYVNLEQLDQLGELLGNVGVPVGAYTGATVSVSANPGDVLLTVAADPETGFAGTPGASIPANQIQIQGATGATGSETVPIKVTFDSALVVTAGQSNALDLEFDLGHPAFIVGHVPPAAGGATIWAVDFNLPLRRHPVANLDELVLRHAYGSVASVASDNSSITIAKDQPARPIVNPETAVPTGVSLTVLADATNGTLFFDSDAGTAVTIKDFSSESSTLTGKFVRVAARYQENGSLVATRIWTSSSFSRVWLSPEGHVLHVDPVNSLIVVSDESGRGVPVAIDGGTLFYFRQPANAVADATAIGVGPNFLLNGNFVRGFKVHTSVIDPMATPMVAETVDIETAAYDGKISNANAVGFDYTRTFATATDNYLVALDYIAPTSANGKDASGNAIMGFKYWNFTYPTLVTSGPNAVTDFVTATTGAVNFGGLVGPLGAAGISYARWGDAANVTGWSAPWTVLLPTRLPLGTVATGYASNGFTMTVIGGTLAATVSVSTTAGSSTLVYQVDRTGGVVTVTAQDITTAAGLDAMTAGLAAGAKVRVYGLPQADLTFKAYVLTYFTGTAPGI